MLDVGGWMSEVGGWVSEISKDFIVFVSLTSNIQLPTPTFNFGFSINFGL